MVLGLLYKKRREGLLTDDIAAPPDFRDLYRSANYETRTDAELREIFRKTLSDLRYSGFFVLVPERLKGVQVDAGDW